MASTPATSVFRRGSATRISDRLRLALVIAGALLSGVLLLWLVDDRVFAGAFAATVLAAAAVLQTLPRIARSAAQASDGVDRALLRAVASAPDQAVAVTDRSGRLVCANDAFGSWFGGYAAPPGLTLSANDEARLAAAGRAAWRDGEARVEGLAGPRAIVDVLLIRAGTAEDHLVWRFQRAQHSELAVEACRLIEGEGGRRLGEAGVMAAMVSGEGRILTANRVLVQRALGQASASVEGRDFVALLRTGADELIRFAGDDDEADPLRLIQVPLENRPDTAALFFLLDEDGSGSSTTGRRGTAEVHLHALLAMLPLGLALADRDGRFLFINRAFERAAGIEPDEAPVYPSDLVVKEDKAAVSDAVRRFAVGHQLSGDIAVRLKGRPDDPVALTIAGAKGLGDAAVLLSLKDNSEENRLKRQVAQATKMQAVGQLAGGVAHDFNNILTAIIGHCDLMLLRHTPGDSDYDDIQQIRHNSNRAASLTRQLLAFSRQQTLRPQILQLPDVISEVSNLLKRLLGETVTLVVKHGRNLGPVRADPGQLEQVIVNLAVNARDAMQAKGGERGGTLTIQTYSVSAEETRRIGSDILPAADYTALSIADTGTGIPPELLSKIFEPFFTTKEVGKGTGLGLSTVYGIVKQTGGFIFADSVPGQGTNFVIYLPVHRADPSVAIPETPVPAVKEKAPDLWGTGTILIVEDEDMVRAVAERALSRQGYKVLTASHGEEALEILEQHGPVDLLVSDVVMPTMDGPTMVRHARERFPEVPVLFMSGYAEEQLRRSIDIDRVHFLAKPFSVQQLAEAARQALITQGG